MLGGNPGSLLYGDVSVMDDRIWYLLNILRMNQQNSTKFCIQIIIDKSYVGIVKHHFLQPLIEVRICFFSVYLERMNRI